MDAADLALISNKELIAIDQAGVPARPLDIQHLRNKPQQAWMTTYADGSAVLSIFNLAPDSATVKLDWREIDALRNTHFAGPNPPALHDLFSGSDVPAEPGGVSVQLESHASLVFRIKP
jgi:hypothetical protein